MMDISISPYCVSRGQSIGCAPAPCRTGMVSILLALIVHPIAVSCCHNSSQKVLISSESKFWNVESGFMPCSQILSPMNDSSFKGEFMNALPGAKENSTAWGCGCCCCCCWARMHWRIWRRACCWCWICHQACWSSSWKAFKIAWSWACGMPACRGACSGWGFMALAIA